ncbi:MAG: hypothetical protein H6810_08405 [Phycisphaeraceae bacterium]|nr:MAG: hypothetical protein H6810_08405 [Phycisphaeraceae bacterium]
MRSPFATIACILASVLLGGCAAPQPNARISSIAPYGGTPSASPTAAGAIPLLINGEPVGWDRITPLLAEAAGGQVVDDLVLHSALERELRARGLTIDDAAVRAEHDRWLSLLTQDGVSADTETAIRRQRGLGPERFHDLLWRNAALRALVDPVETEVTDDEVRLASEIRAGRRFATSGVVLPDARSALDVAERARADASGPVAGLWAAAIEHGVLPWHAVLSPHDPATPAALRAALAATPIGSPSGVIALDDGFGVLLVHSEIPASTPPPGAALRDELGLKKARLAMERLARRLIASTPSHVLDGGLSWGR